MEFSSTPKAFRVSTSWPTFRSFSLWHWAASLSWVVTPYTISAISGATFTDSRLLTVMTGSSTCSTWIFPGAWGGSGLPFPFPEVCTPWPAFPQAVNSNAHTAPNVTIFFFMMLPPVP